MFVYVTYTLILKNDIISLYFLCRVYSIHDAHEEWIKSNRQMLWELHFGGLFTCIERSIRDVTKIIIFTCES